MPKVRLLSDLLSSNSLSTIVHGVPDIPWFVSISQLLENSYLGEHGELHQCTLPAKLVVLDTLIDTQTVVNLYL